MSEIALRDVRRSYGHAHALNGVSLTADAGKVLALLGPSGSGKSTILRLISGLEPVNAGTIHVGGELLSSARYTTPAEARRIGVVFQDYALFPHLTAAENVAFGVRGASRAEREHVALHWLDRVGLKQRAGAYPHELSGGEQQRVALARALAPKPRAVLLDEPFSGLDSVLRAEMRDATLQTLAEADVTTLFVTHDAEDALQAADKLVLLKAGRVLQEAAPRDAYDAPASLDVAAALGPINVFSGRVVNGAVATPFGAVPATHVAEGALVQAVVRAEASRLTPGPMARVLSVRPHGAHDLARIEADGVVWRVLSPARAALGERVNIEIDPAGVFVFPA